MSDSSKAVCLKDVEEAAHKILPKKALDYYKSGAEQQSTLRDNIRAFQRYQAIKGIEDRLIRSFFRFLDLNQILMLKY